MTLEAGKVYVITLYTEQGNVLNYKASPEDADFSSIEILLDGTNAGTYVAGAEPWIRLNFDEALIVKETKSNNLNLTQNFPNPFNTTSVISYNLNETTNVSLTIMDVTGKIISSINEGTQASGVHKITIEGTSLAQGTYFYTLTAGSFQVTKRMVVSK